jgi:hypothetical protein
MANISICELRNKRCNKTATTIRGRSIWAKEYDKYFDSFYLMITEPVPSEVEGLRVPTASG